MVPAMATCVLHNPESSPYTHRPSHRCRRQLLHEPFAAIRHSVAFPLRRLLAPSRIAASLPGILRPCNAAPQLAVHPAAFCKDGLHRLECVFSFVLPIVGTQVVWRTFPTNP